jgi:hypothetical protein
MKKLLFPTILCLVVAMVAGCATTITTRNPQPQGRTEVAQYTPEDVDRAVQAWIEDLLKFGPVATSPEPPLVGFCGVINKGREHIEMGLFDRSFEYSGLRTNKVRFTNAMKLPDSFFEQHKMQKSLIADPATAVAIGKIQGWKYAIYGELYITKATDAKNNPILYYDVYVYMLNIETAEQVWNSRDKFVVDIKRAGIGR